MPGTFLVSHGSFIDDADTFVPSSMTVHLYADIGEAIPAPNVIEILRYRGRQSVGTVAGGGLIKNLYLTALSQNQYETELGAVQPGEIVCFLGYDAPATGDAGFTLCMGMCDRQSGTHDCPGIFGLFKDVTDLHLLVCLEELVYAEPAGEVLPDQEMPDQQASGAELSDDDNERKTLPWETEPEHYNRITDLADQISRAVGYNPENDHIASFGSVAAAQLFDALSYEDQAKLMTFEQVQRWSYIRYARQTLKQLGADDFANWCNSQEPWVQDIYKKDTDVVGPYLR